MQRITADRDSARRRRIGPYWSVPDDEVRRVQPEFASDEQWSRLPQDELRWVEAIRDGRDGIWQVYVSLAQVPLEEEPLRTDVRGGITRALQGVSGVVTAAEEDQETWVVSGSPAGDDLVRAASTVVDEFLGVVRAHSESLAALSDQRFREHYEPRE
jgi:hypothetical protein